MGVWGIFSSKKNVIFDLFCIFNCIENDKNKTKMSKYLKLFDTHNEYSAFTQTEDFVKPNVSHCIQENEVHYNPYDYSDRYLTFVVRESGTTFQFNGKTVDNVVNVASFSIDNGETWTELPSGATTAALDAGDRILWKGEMTPNSSNYEGIGTFTSTKTFDVEGNVMSLLFGDNFKGQTSLDGKNYVFSNLFFENTNVVSAKNLSLPATTLANYCYGGMFWGCTSLTTAPELHATTLAQNCYNGMFRDCTSLTRAPELPATTLANSCYVTMFYGCTSLTTAPQLPATTLADYCYFSMFQVCTSLTSTPELPATTLANSCYQYMFRGCTNLNYIKAMFTTTPSDTYTKNWVDGVASTGTFVKNSAATWNVSGVNGVPEGWTVETASA